MFRIILLLLTYATTSWAQTSNLEMIYIEWPQGKLDRTAGYKEGKALAESNFLQGKYLYLAIRREAWKPEDHFLNEKYGISPTFGTPTNTTEHILGWIEGYNDRVAELFREKFGTNVMQEAKQAVQQEKARRGSKSQ